MGLQKMNSKKVAKLIIILREEMTYIRKANDWSKILLQYSTDIKELKLQVLLHGYKILENTLNEFGIESDYFGNFQIKKYMLKQIS